MKHLEPKVTSKASYSILLLRDDSSAVRFSLKPFWVKFLVVFFALFSLSSGIAGYSAHYYWKKYTTLQRKQSVLDTQLGENRRKLDEFAGIERAGAVLPRSSMASVAVAAPGGSGGRQSAVNGEGTGSSGASMDQAAPGGLQTAQNAGAQPPEAHSHAADAPPLAPGGGQGGQYSSAAVSPGQQPQAEPPEKKEHPALIDEVQIRQTGTGRYSVSFGLSNRDKQIRLNGRVHISVSGKDGKRHEVSQSNRDALRFVINNYKKVVTSFSLSPGMDAENVSRLYLTVTAEDLPDITYTFAMPASPSAAPREDAAPETGA